MGVVPTFQELEDRHPRLGVRAEARAPEQLITAEDDLGQELRRLSNRLREQLQRFYPQALTLCA